MDEPAGLRVLASSGWTWEGGPVEVTTTEEATVVEPGTIRRCPTCNRTGQVGVEFYESRPTYCKRCTANALSQHAREVNDASRDTAENHRQPWSELEVEMLLQAMAEGMCIKDIAEMLGRTWAAVHAKDTAVRRLLASGQPVSYIVRTETTVRVTRNPNHVGSAPDEDRWWEASYYTKENAR